MKNLILPVSIILLALATACAPIIYEAPRTSYPSGHHRGQGPPVIVKVPPGHRHGHHRHDYRRIERELERRHRRSAALYRGEGRPGALIEITIRGGYLHHHGRRIGYNPVTILIAEGDIRRLPSLEPGVDIYVLYERGRIALDTDIFGGFTHTVTRVDFGNNRRHHNFHINNRYLKGARGVASVISPRHDHVGQYKDRHGNHHRKRNQVQEEKRSDWQESSSGRHKKVDEKRHRVVQRRQDDRKSGYKRHGNGRDRNREKRSEFFQSRQRQRQADERRQTVAENKSDRFSQPDKVRVAFRSGKGRQELSARGNRRASVVLRDGQTRMVRIDLGDRTLRLPVRYQEGRLVIRDKRGSNDQVYGLPRERNQSRSYRLDRSINPRLEGIEMVVTSL